MTPIISFAWTTGALLAGAKTVTRRDWDPDYARRFKPGMEVTAYDKSPRNGGKPVARLRLVSVTHEPDVDAPNSDWAAEGFEWFWLKELDKAWADDPGCDLTSEIADRTSFEGFGDWREAGGSSWVIRFEVLEYLRGPLKTAEKGAE